MNLIASNKDKSLTIRIPQRCLAAIKRAAAKNGRSQNSEIVVRLAKSIELDAAPHRGGGAPSDTTIAP